MRIGDEAVTIMNVELIGEEVTLTGTGFGMLRLVVAATESFVTAADAAGCDSAQLEAGVRQVLDEIGDPSTVAIRARLVIVAEGIDVIIGSDSEGSEPQKISCRV